MKSSGDAIGSTTPRAARLALAIVAIVVSGGLRPEIRDSPRARLASAELYVGQTVDLSIECSESEPPATLNIPSTGWKNLTPIGDPRKRTTPELPGWSLTLRATQVGEARVPSLSVSNGDAAQSTPPIRAKVLALPMAGRPPDFFGGVGALRVSSALDPREIHLGERAVLILTLSGPGALGTAPPSPPIEWAQQGLKIESLAPGSDSGDPKSIRYVLRPQSEGEFTISFPTVATFDPMMGRYVSRRPPAQHLRVLPAPEIRVDLPRRGPPQATRWIDHRVALALAAIALIVSWASVVGIRRVRGPMVDLEAEIRALRESWTHDPSPAALASTIIACWTRILESLSRRPIGALTPYEARDRLIESTGDAVLADRVAGLLQACDRVLFGQAQPAAHAESEYLAAVEPLRLEAIETLDRFRGLQPTPEQTQAKSQAR